MTTVELLCKDTPKVRHILNLDTVVSLNYNSIKVSLKCGHLTNLGCSKSIVSTIERFHCISEERKYFILYMKYSQALRVHQTERSSFLDQVDKEEDEGGGHKQTYF